MVRDYKDLRVWQLPMNLVEQTYRLTRTFPRQEVYGLSRQVRRAAVSIPSNIAEGQTRQSRQEFLHYLSIGSASLSEVETQIEIARRLGYIDAKLQCEVQRDADSLGRQLRALRKSLRGPTSPQPPVPGPRA